ncbi:MAG TPA: hypothetical protein VIL48_19860 [Acidimicrobiales bacterium]
MSAGPEDATPAAGAPGPGTRPGPAPSPADPSQVAPAPAPGGRGLPSPFAAVVGYTLRSCLPARRRLILVAICLGGVALGLLTPLIDAESGVSTAEAFGVVAEQGLFGLILPLTCLVVGDAVMGADIRAGTFPLTWLSPVPLRTIAVGRWLGGWLVALLTVVPALTVAVLVAGVPDAGAAAATMALAAATGSAAYIGLFIMIGVVVRRSAVWSLALVFLGERLLGASLSGIAQLSPLWEAQQVYAGLGPGGAELVRDGTPQGWGAVARLALILVVTLAVAGRRLRRLTPTGGDE